MRTGYDIRSSANLRKDPGRCQAGDAWDGIHKRNQIAKGAVACGGRFLVKPGDCRIHLSVDLANGSSQGIVLTEVKPQQEPVMLRQPAVQRIVELFGRGFDPPVSQLRQLPGIAHTRNHRLDHPPPGQPHDLADHQIEFDVGLFERLLHPLYMPRLFAAQLLARAHQRAQFLELLSGTKLALMRPKATRSAIQVASFTSVLRPGTFLMWAALAKISSNLPSLRIFHTGFQ